MCCNFVDIWGIDRREKKYLAALTVAQPPQPTPTAQCHQPLHTMPGAGKALRALSGDIGEGVHTSMLQLGRCRVDRIHEMIQHGMLT